MALDPESQRLIDLMAAANRPAWNTLSAQAARDLYLSLRPGAQGPRPADVTVVDRTIPGPAGELPVRIYRPASAPADAPLPALVYAHGGGWVFGNLDSHDVLCAQLALEAGIAVFHVDYRLAPEARFPGAFDDVVAGLKWVAANGASVGIDPARLAIGGDSAGGNLAAAVSIWARDHGGPKLLMQLLAYPVTDAVARADSYRRYEDGYGLNAITMEWFFDHYTPDKTSRGDWRVSPLRAASLAGLPPALVVTAGYDPLRDEGRAYAERLRASGVKTIHREFETLIHGFIGMRGAVHAAARAMDDMVAGLRHELAQLGR
jgi:acetyl esterase